MCNTEEKYCLRWNDFENNLSRAFKDIKDDNDFLDVTLACGGNKQIKAHKVILGACSSFFRGILKQNPHQHPLLYMKGVKYEEMLSVLDFMYHGEVNIAQEDLSSFLNVAKELEVKGLTQNGDQENAGSEKKVKKATSDKSGMIAPPTPTVTSPGESSQSYLHEPFVSTETVEQIKTEDAAVTEGNDNQEFIAQEVIDDTNAYEVITSEYDYNEEYLGQPQGQDLDMAQDFGIHQNFSWKQGRSEKKTVPCEICFKTFSSKDSLRNHLGIHKGRTTCTICQKVFATISSLNLHVKNSHLRDQ